MRRVKAGTQWHPATDRLQGTDVYGTPSSATADETFSVEFGEFDQFLFATGDGAKWLIADKDQVYGSYSNSQRTILRSSISETSYLARWYNRNGYQEDPWISLTDHDGARTTGNILYGGNRAGGTHATTILPYHNGANVFVRAHPTSPPPPPPPAAEVNPLEHARTYSSVYSNSGAGTGYARSMLDSAECWYPKHRSAGEWMQIDAGDGVMVSGVITQGRAGYNQWVTQYSVDVALFPNGPFTRVGSFEGNSDRDTKELRGFTPVRARYVRIVVDGWYSSIAMRAGLVVNSLPPPPPPTPPSPPPSPPSPPSPPTMPPSPPSLPSPPMQPPSPPAPPSLQIGRAHV